MTETTETHFLLAYDATCGTCRKISREVAHASDGRLTVVPLTRPDIQRWRAQALGEHPPWTPTLLQLRGGNARAWTGPTIAAPLIRQLGLRRMINIVQVLGRMRRDETPTPRTERSGATALPLLWAGALIAARLLLTGKPPIPAARENAEAAHWAAAHRENLPRTYDDVTAQPVSYQRAIFDASPLDVQSHLWVQALERDRASRPDLPQTQEEIYDRAIELARDKRLFTTGQERDPVLHQRLLDLRRDTLHAFQSTRDCRLLLTLGKTKPLL